MRAPSAVLVSLAALLALWPARVRADAGPDLREGDRAMDSLDYGRAVAAFERVTSARDAGAAELVHAYAALVRCQVVLGNETSARLAAEQLLELDPGARIEGGNIPPRVTRFYEDLRRAFHRTTETVVAMTLPDPIPTGRAMEVSARVTRGRRGVAAVKLHAQFGEDEPVVAVDLEARERSWVGRLQVPATFDPEVSSLRYWVEALAPSGTPLGGLGSEDEPMIVAPTGRHGGGGGDGRAHHDPDVVPDPDPHGRGARGHEDGDTLQRNEEYFRRRQALTSQWWFWTGIAVVVAGGALTAAILATDEGDPARHGEDGDRLLP